VPASFNYAAEGLERAERYQRQRLPGYRLATGDGAAASAGGGRGAESAAELRR